MKIDNSKTEESSNDFTPMFMGRTLLDGKPSKAQRRANVLIRLGNARRQAQAALRKARA